MQQILVGLGLALVTGITVLAYKHPKGYAGYLHVPLLALILAASVLGLGMNLGMHMLFKALMPLIPITKTDEAVRLTAQASLPEWFYLACGMAVSYLLFLKMLPVILAEDKKDASPKSPSD
jgi:hypothetical protein